MEKNNIKLQTFNLSYLFGKSYSHDDESQNYLIFQLIPNTFRIPTGDTERIMEWKSKGFPSESIEPPTTSDNSFAPELKWIHNSKIAVEFKKSCSKQDKDTFNNTNVASLLNVYELDT